MANIQLPETSEMKGNTGKGSEYGTDVKAGCGRLQLYCRSVLANDGSVVTQIILFAAMLVFVILPVFSAVIEKYILMAKARVIRDAVDVTNISAYNALTVPELGKVMIGADTSKILENYKEILMLNLRLDDGMEPENGSIAEGRVEIISLEVYSSGFPVECPDGGLLTKPSVHSSIRVPVRPSLYSSIILGMLGRDYIDIIVHVDSEIPVNN